MGLAARDGLVGWVDDQHHGEVRFTLAYMAIAALVVAVLALVISGLSVAYTRRNTHAAEAADRRARTPRLATAAEHGAEGATSVIYRVRNDGPQDLDSLVVFRPRPMGGISYPIAKTGMGWAEDEIDLGPLAVTQEARFTLSVGSGSSLPTFRVRVKCRAGRDKWELAEELEEPRRGVSVY